MELLKALQKLPDGYYRLILAGWLILPLILPLFMIAENTDGVQTFMTWFFGVLIYYILAWIFVWIRAGFKEEE